jgi:hypothetical protein
MLGFSPKAQKRINRFFANSIRIRDKKGQGFDKRGALLFKFLRHDNKKKKNMKKLVFLLLVATAAQSQSLAGFVGYKAGEIDITLHKELIYGVGVSIIDSDIISKRASKYDGNKIYQAQTAISPTVFLLLGRKIDQITVMGKLGLSYVDQTINGSKSAKNLYSAIGIQVGYNNFLFNFDSCNSVMIGYRIKLKK